MFLVDFKSQSRPYNELDACQSMDGVWEPEPVPAGSTPMHGGSSFVSGYRFIDTVSPSKPDAPLGAGGRNRVSRANCAAAARKMSSLNDPDRKRARDRPTALPR